MIAATMTIEEILSSYPAKSQKLAQVLTQAGLHCVGCGAATWETLEAGVLGHGMSDEDLTRILEGLNTVLAEEEAPVDSVTLTEKAAERFFQILKEEKKEGWALRFGDKPGGCGGYEYILDFSKEAGPDDVIYHCLGVDIHINKNQLPRLLGCSIDYADGLMGGGFKVSNPNAKGSCSCGNSQSY